VYPRRCAVDCRNHLTTIVGRVTTYEYIREIKEKQFRINTLCESILLMPAYGWRIEKDANRSFVFITALRMRN